MDTNNNDSILQRLQRKYLIGAAMLAPISPFLYLQGQITRWKVGLLPDAAGDKQGKYGEGDNPFQLYVIGESTVAGLGARTHELALAGQFAKYLSLHKGHPVKWKVLGKNGVTARRTINELIPQMPDDRFDYVLLGIGGNDVMRLSSPRKWRRDMIELIEIVRKKNPHATIFISNCPMIVYSPIMPPPIKAILWKLSQMHDANIREFTNDMERVFYFPQPVNVPVKGFFEDGIHPSEQGYADWAEAMIKHFAANHEW